MIERRRFLQVVGIGAATGVVASCTSGSPSPPSSSTAPVAATTVPPTTSTAPTPPDWAALRGRLGGGLVLQGEPGYDIARRSYNTVHDGRTPTAVARCRSTADVQACVEVARTSRIPVAARSGGHSYAGYSVPQRGLVIDLGAMAGVTVGADGTAVIGGGTRLIDVYAGLAAAGRCLPGGSCPTVGIGGLALGGGIGVLARKYGLTCDRLVSAQVVTADGTLRTASASSEPDLYWALRGGGGGNAGIVTSFTFATEAAPTLAVFALRYPAGSVASVIGAWQHWAASAPDELWSNCVVSGGSPPTCRVGGCFVGSTSALNSLVDALVAAAAAPSSRSVASKGYLDAMRYFAGCSTKTVTQCHPDSAGGTLGREGFVASSRMVSAPFGDPSAVAAVMTGHSGVDLLLDSLGGAVGRVGAGETAFPHRSALASAQIYAAATTSSVTTATASVAAIRDGLAPLAGTGAYVNYIDAGLPDWGRAYYGDNLSRLREVAKHYDPDGVFTFAQSVRNA